MRLCLKDVCRTFPFPWSFDEIENGISEEVYGNKWSEVWLGFEASKQGADKKTKVQFVWYLQQGLKMPENIWGLSQKTPELSNVNRFQAFNTNLDKFLQFWADLL